MADQICRFCRGHGEVEADCPDCDGTGYDPHEDKPHAQCEECHGEGVREQFCRPCGGTGVMDDDYEDDYEDEDEDEDEDDQY